jgi:hypothetical protein
MKIQLLDWLYHVGIPIQIQHSQWRPWIPIRALPSDYCTGKGIKFAVLGFIITRD